MFSSAYTFQLSERCIDFDAETMTPASIMAVAQIATSTTRNNCAYLMPLGGTGDHVWIYRPEALRRITLGALEQMGEWYIDKP